MKILLLFYMQNLFILKKVIKYFPYLKQKETNLLIHLIT